eukprot:13652037-Alexandrium_andersonii.AAC.1
MCIRDSFWAARGGGMAQVRAGRAAARSESTCRRGRAGGRDRTARAPGVVHPRAEISPAGLRRTPRGGRASRLVGGSFRGPALSLLR